MMIYTDAACALQLPALFTALTNHTVGRVPSERPRSTNDVTISEHVEMCMQTLPQP